MVELLIIASFLSFFLSGLVFLKKNKGRHDYLFASWLIFTGLHVLVVYLEHLNYQNDFSFSWIIGLSMSWVMVHPIWLFIYIVSFLRPKTRISNYFWHFIPLLAVNLLMISRQPFLYEGTL